MRRFALAVLAFVLLLAPEAMAAASWSKVGSDARGPGARRDHQLAATSPGTIFLFGGRAGGVVRDDLWRLTLGKRRWTRVRPAGPRPAARFGHNLVAEPGGTLLLFGGQAGEVFFNDVWRYDPASSRWTAITPAGGGPAQRYGAAAATDPVTGALHVSHGFTHDGRFDDTWSFAASAFSDVSGAPRPLARCLASGVVHGGRFWLFGGQSNSDPFHGDLWRLDPVTRVWEELQPALRPSARNLYASAQRGSRWYVHGGGTDAGLDDQLWRLDLDRATWRQLKINGRRPSPRNSHAGAPVKGGLVIFGGQVNGGESGETWRLRL